MEPGASPATTISSLVITLATEPVTRARALVQLAEAPGLEPAPLQGAWLPAVLETTDPYGAIQHIEAIPGVLFVEVIFVEVAAA